MQKMRLIFGTSSLEVPPNEAITASEWDVALETKSKIKECSSFSFSGPIGFIGTISEVEVGPQTTLIYFHPCEVKSIEIKNDECPDYILSGAKIRVMWVESITVELISAAPTDKLSVEEVAEIFNVPPHILGAPKLS